MNFFEKTPPSENTKPTSEVPVKKPTLIKKTSPQFEATKRTVVEIEDPFENHELLELKQYGAEAHSYLEKSRIQEDNFRDIDPQLSKRNSEVNRIEGAIHQSHQEEKVSFGSRDISVSKKQEEELTMAIAQTLEAGIALLIDTHEWLGANVHARPASRFDDIKRGIDVVAYQEERGVVKKETALATDETMSLDGVKFKLSSILQQIKNGTATKMRYFEAASTTTQGQAFRKMEVPVPKVVIALSRRGILEMGRMLWGQESPRTEGHYEAIENHGGKIALQEVILKQLEALSGYAKKHRQFEIAKLYQDRADLITQGIETRKNALENPETKKQYTAWKNNPAIQQIFSMVQQIHEGNI